MSQPPRSNRDAKYPPTPWSAQRLFRPYVRASIAIAVALGFSVGAAMLVTPLFGAQRDVGWFGHTQAHGAAQAFGWAGLFILGIAYHVVPRFRNGSIAYPWPQRFALIAIVLGLVLRFAGQTISPSTVSSTLLIASGVLVLAGVTAAVYVLGRALAGGTAARTPGEHWLWPALLWAVAAAALHCAVVIEMAVRGFPLAASDWNAAYIQAAIFGFATNFIIGVSARAVGPFLGLRPVRGTLLAAALVVFNTGLLLTVIENAVRPGVTRVLDWAAWSGDALAAAGLVMAIAAMRVLEPAARKQTYIAGTYTRYEWFVRTAFAWLAIAALFMLEQALEAAVGWRLIPAANALPVLHIVALGFVTAMIMGMGARMLPLFEASQLPNQRLMDLAFLTLNVSVGLRMLFGFVEGGSRWGLAVSGVLGFVALLCFAVPAWRAMLPSSRQTYKQTAELVVKRRMHPEE